MGGFVIFNIGLSYLDAIIWPGNKVGSGDLNYQKVGQDREKCLFYPMPFQGKAMNEKKVGHLVAKVLRDDTGSQCLPRDTEIDFIKTLAVIARLFSIPMPGHRIQYDTVRVGCPRNEKKIFSVRTETNRNKICFAFVSVCFVKPQIFFFWFVSVIRTFIETTETNRTVSKRTETIQNLIYQCLCLCRLRMTIYWTLPSASTK